MGTFLHALTVKLFFELLLFSSICHDY